MITTHPGLVLRHLDQRDRARAGPGKAQSVLGHGLAVADHVGAGVRAAGLPVDRQPVRPQEAPRRTTRGREGGQGQPRHHPRPARLTGPARLARLSHGPQPPPRLAARRAEQLRRTVPRLRGIDPGQSRPSPHRATLRPRRILHPVLGRHHRTVLRCPGRSPSPRGQSPHPVRPHLHPQHRARLQRHARQTRCRRPRMAPHAAHPTPERRMAPTRPPQPPQNRRRRRPLGIRRITKHGRLQLPQQEE